MPHELLGYDLRSVEGVLLSVAIMTEVAERQADAAKNPQSETSKKQQGRRDRMKHKNPGYI